MEVLTPDTLYRVTSDQAPTGTFLLELAETLSLSLLTFDTAPMPSQPDFRVEVSANGVGYTPATVSRNGYRLNAWVQPQPVRFVRLTITPSHSDVIAGERTRQPD